MKEKNRYYHDSQNPSSEKLYEAISEIDDHFVEKAENYTFSKGGFLRSENISAVSKTPHRIHWKKVAWVATAASICLVLGTVITLFLGGRAGGGGADSLGSSYMSYAGPVFPLTSTSNVTGIEVTRHTNWDFSPYISEFRTEKMHTDIPENTETFTYERYETESIVSENYVLTNTTNEDLTLSLLYPFAARFSDAIQTVPQISVDGSKVTTAFLAGKYSGSYAPAIGDEDSDEKLNLHEPSYWTDYKALLSDGRYLSESMADVPSLDIPIIVYEYSNLTYIGEPKAINPTFAISFKHDPAKTTISGWGWNAGGWDGDGSGYYGCSRVYTPGGNDFNKGATAYFIVIGEDIETPAVKSYTNAGCDEENEIDGLTYDFQKYETTLEQFLSEVCLSEYMENTEFMTGFDYFDDAYIQSFLTKEMVLGYIAQLMYDDGILSEDSIERYGDDCWLEHYVYDFSNMSRVMYLMFDVTIPANASITVNTTMTKDASFDYAGKNKERNGYDMVTSLASPFTFTKQTASISNYDSIEILEQNFGFDIESGITQVELDLNEEHYWMDIKKKVMED